MFTNCLLVAGGIAIGAYIERRIMTTKAFKICEGLCDAIINEVKKKTESGTEKKDN
jgi:hypothetical protein